MDNESSHKAEPAQNSALADEIETLVQACIAVMRQEKKVSTSLLQRRFGLGYTAASKIMDVLEQRGYVSKADGGATSRQILVDLESGLPLHGEPVVQNHVVELKPGQTVKEVMGSLIEAEQNREREAAEVRAMLAEPATVAAPAITKATVRVMRSHDYCHFEVTLGTETEWSLDGKGVARYVPIPIERVDALRKEAARLVDKAVKQFQVAKLAAEKRSKMEDDWRYRQALAVPEGERSPEQKAVIKFRDDQAFARRFDYDYEDNWHREEDDSD